jgi:hypothetical protein
MVQYHCRNCGTLENDECYIDENGQPMCNWGHVVEPIPKYRVSEGEYMTREALDSPYQIERVALHKKDFAKFHADAIQRALQTMQEEMK